MSLLQMSLSGALIITAITILRILGLYKFSPKMFFVLWLIALFRLLVPVAIPSPTSIANLLPNRAVADITRQHQLPAAYNDAVIPTHMPDITGTYMGTFQVQDILNLPTAPNPEQLIAPVTLTWLAGAALSGLFFTVAYIKARVCFASSFPVKNAAIRNWLKAHRLKRRVSVRMSNKVANPLTYGVIRPVILLPAHMDLDNISELEYVLAHEFVHIRRFDALTKIIATCALCIHWFNPMVWVMYFLLNRDIETSCDESVVTMYGTWSKKGYAQTLVSLVERGGYMPNLYDNFSKHAIEERIKIIMKIKKKTIFGAVTTVAVAALITAVFATNGLPVLVAPVYASVTLPLPPAIEAQQTNEAPATVLPNRLAEPPGLDRAVQRAVESTGAVRENGFGGIMLTFGDPFGEPGANSISIEEAARIGLATLANIYGADLNLLANHDIQIFYSKSFDPLYFPEIDDSAWERPDTYWQTDAQIIRSADDLPDEMFPMAVFRNTWNGTVRSTVARTPEDDDGRMFRGHEFFRFTIAADTGEIISTQFFPSEDPIERGPEYIEDMGNAYAVWEYSNNFTTAHNTRYAALAKQTMEELGLFEGEVLRASLLPGGGWRAGRNRSFELNAAVVVECVNGELVTLIFQGRNRRELVDVHFHARMISHSVNRDGSIASGPDTQTRNLHEHVTNNFGWVYR